MKQIKKYKLNSVYPTEHTGHCYDPFTWEEFITMYNLHIWQGGYVEERGYIPCNVHVVGSSIMVIDGLSDCSNNFYYPYSFFIPIDTTLHHTYYNLDGLEIELTDIRVKANIDVYRLTVEVDINNKGDYDLCLLNVYLLNNSQPIEIPEDINSSTGDNMFSGKITYDLPHDPLSSPNFSLKIDCNYYHDNQTDFVTCDFLLYSE